MTDLERLREAKKEFEHCRDGLGWNEDAPNESARCYALEKALAAVMEVLEGLLKEREGGER